MIFKKRKKAVKSLFTVILVMISVSVCSCKKNSPTGDETAETQELIPVMAELTEKEEPQPYPVIINDTVIEKKPQRVVSLSPSLTEMICEMGYGGTLVGRGSYCDYPEGMRSLPDVGRPAKPDHDAIIALSPDILFTATAIPVKDVYNLEEHGIKTVYISYPHSINEFENIYKALGLIFEGLFDGEEKGAEGFAPIKKELEGGSLSLGGFVYITEELSVATGDTFESSVLSCFGKNLGAEGNDYSFPKEFLIELQPDVILLNNSYSADDLNADEVYSQLEAVASGKIILIDNSYFERPSARICKLFETLRENN